jgi:hypothetical protein
MIREISIRVISKFLFPSFQIIKYKLKLDRKSPMIRYIRRKKPRKILEIGVHQGDFAKRMLNGLKQNNFSDIEYTGIDLFAELQTSEIYKKEKTLWPDSRDAVYSKLNSEFPGLNIRLLSGFSDELLKKLFGEKFDLIFIDGGHSRETVYSDWVLSQPLLAEQGVIYFDDYTNSKGLRNSGFGINYVVDEIDNKQWAISISRIRDWFIKDWGILALRIVKVQRKYPK